MTDRHMKKFSSSFIIKELQIKTTRLNLTPKKMAYQKDWSNVGRDVMRKESLFTIGGTVIWFSLYGKQYDIL